MVKIGFMHYNKKPTGLNRAYAFAAVAKAEGAELLFFSPGAVDFQNKKINGYIYKNGKWINTISEFPDVICNVVGFQKEKQDDIVNQLRKVIPFTSSSIGSKLTVYKNILKYNEYKDYLIPTEIILSVDHFFKFLDQYEEIVLKPSMGNQGKSIHFVKKINDHYEILSGSEKTSYDYYKMADFISDKISNDVYIIQRYINCRTKNGNSYDFRLHVQKNMIGEWVTTQIYFRVAEKGCIVCNISSGGYTGDLTAFLQREFGDEYMNIKGYIEAFSLQIAIHMDIIQKELYNEVLDELGIDIGLDENRQICLYEINWRPGYPPSMDADLNVFINTIHYAIYIANKDKLKTS